MLLIGQKEPLAGIHFDPMPPGDTMISEIYVIDGDEFVMVVQKSLMPDRSGSPFSSPQRPVERDDDLPDRNSMAECLIDEIQCDRDKLEELYYDESICLFTREETASRIGEIRENEKTFNRERFIVDGVSIGTTVTLAAAGLCLNPLFLPLAALALAPCLAKERKAHDYIPVVEKEIAQLDEKLGQSKRELEAIAAQKGRVEERIKNKENALSLLAARRRQGQQSPPTAIFSEVHN
jgi:hypothetical protein